ncbi:TPA: 23S rRNA (guanosine(2251)-2'-O)-methyltransferase RlmB [Candidatus Dependentiae bacterium]|nr:MAG: rRNA methylase [candidate division TM6 bacterium GW2011_GWF2_36_131]KKQ03806.1 MAG: rRNA methylase [candidate division TM6 bacterium GW2011_GWE2_36_25]KKQ19952.1 MAG: rRNA methylase [candidate division TM6 bacterium GW2011_GWA2_36_9]HBR70574.1 23S rRNA (guanosine(2251)-2'-O)-methyltransferase RlmB [Candidatus Dependentiae bacterium]HCU00710.1 23S rRNA (guanosine(2251)-2'-O)-methyltransferase RlmB [Candidatus Dependentiae bacterium]
MKQKTVEIVYGVHPILELLKAKKRKITTLYVLQPEPKTFKQIKACLPVYPIKINYKSRQELTQLSGTPDHQGIVALASPFQTRKKTFDPKLQPFIILLDGIQDPRNLGAILRSTYCTGFQGVILTQKGTAPLNAVVLKAAAGLAEHLEIAVAPSAGAALQQLKQDGYHIYISALEKNAHDATKIIYEKPLCLVIGSEGTGVSKDILNKGQTVIVPQRTSDISYNASVAAGILMFLVAHQCKILS